MILARFKELCNYILFSPINIKNVPKTEKRINVQQLKKCKKKVLFLSSGVGQHIMSWLELGHSEKCDFHLNPRPILVYQTSNVYYDTITRVYYYNINYIHYLYIYYNNRI